MAEVMLEIISDGCDSVRRFSVWRRLSSLCSGRGWDAMRFGAVAGADDEFDGVELGRGGDVERQPLGRRTSSGSSSAGGSGEMRWVGGWMGWCFFGCEVGVLAMQSNSCFARGCEALLSFWA